MCVGFAIVSMVGTNFHISKLIKGESAPGPNEIGPRAQVRSGPIGPQPVFFFQLFLNYFLFFHFFIFDFFLFYSGSYYCWLQIGSCILHWLHLQSR